MEPRLRPGAGAGAFPLSLIFGYRAWQTDRRVYENAEARGLRRSPQCRRSLMALLRPFAAHLFGFCEGRFLRLNRRGRFAGVVCFLRGSLHRGIAWIPNGVNRAPPKFVVRRPHLDFVLPQFRDDALNFSAANFRQNFVTNFEWILHEGRICFRDARLRAW